MAQSTAKKKTEDGPPSVDLTHPDGERHYEATTPVELHNLVSGHGYRITEAGLSLEDAATRLVPNVAAAGTAGAGAGAAPDAGTTPATTTTTTTTSGTAS